MQTLAHNWHVSDDAAPGPIDHHAVDDTLNLAQLGRDVLTQCVVGTQRLRLDAADDLLGTFHQRIEIGIRANVELTEAIEELGQVVDRGVSEDLALAIAIVA